MKKVIIKYDTVDKEEFSFTDYSITDKLALFFNINGGTDFKYFNMDKVIYIYVYQDELKDMVLKEDNKKFIIHGHNHQYKREWKEDNKK